MFGRKWLNGTLWVRVWRKRGVAERSRHIRMPLAPAGWEHIYKRWERLLERVDSGIVDETQLYMNLPPIWVGPNRNRRVNHWRKAFDSHGTIKQVMKTLGEHLR
jgi:hypothetical protein